MDPIDLDDIDLDAEDFGSSLPIKKVPNGNVFEASRAGDVDRLRYLLESGLNVNERDQWDSVALYYACLAGHLEAVKMLLECGAICSEHTFDGDRCHYAALNLKVRKLLKKFEARPPPLSPLQTSLRETFLSSSSNRHFLGLVDGGKQASYSGSNLESFPCYLPCDVIFYVQGRPIEAHRVILSARSPFFKRKFESDWKWRKEVRFGKEKLSYAALFALIHFFYSDRLEIAVEDMEDLVRICKVCKCVSLQQILEKELFHQTNAEYKSLRDIDNSQKRFILQGSSLPIEDRLPAALSSILHSSFANSVKDQGNFDQRLLNTSAISSIEFEDDFADVCVRVGDRVFRCHQLVLSSRSEYFRARLSHMNDFLIVENESLSNSLPCFEERDLTPETFEKMVEYMYTDSLINISPDQAEEMFDAASRYLLFSLKRAVADALMPHLETVSPAELCHWLILSDMYGVGKIREFCLDMISSNFETFADTHEFRSLLLSLPPPSGDSSLRTTAPSAPGASANCDQANLLDDLREKWLEAEAAELAKRDESALLFDKRLEMLILVAGKEKSDACSQSNF